MIDTTTWTQEQWDNARNVLIEQLKAAEKVEITFEKVDGTIRTMICSLSPAVLPPIVESAEPKKERKVNLDNLAVWDLEAKAWRSLRVRSLKTINV